MDKRSKILLAGVIVLALGLLLDQLVYKPWKENWDRLGEELRKTNRAIFLAKEKVKQEPKARADWKKIKEKLDDPKREGMDTSFFSFVGTLAASADPRPRLDQRASEQVGDFKEVIVDANLSCSIEGFKNFLKAVYNTPEYLKIRRLTITSQYERADEKLVVDAKVSTIVYSPKPNPKPQ